MTYTNWLEYFQSNQNHFSGMDFSEPYRLTPKEKSLITESIQQFQKGENSEGKNLKKHAAESNEVFYAESIKYFIKEEQRHSLALAKFMEENGIEKIRHHWVDGVFRRLRNLAGLENSIIVLVTAEIIAAVYYRFLKLVTKSNTLRDICTQILSDEEMHINFQSFTLKKLYDKKSAFGKFFVRAFHKFLMTGTVIVVWIFHKQVFKACGTGFKSFYRSVFEEYYRSDSMIKGKLQIEIRNNSDELVLNPAEELDVVYRNF